MAPLVLTGRSAASTERQLVGRVSVLPHRLEFAVLPSVAPHAGDDSSPAATNSESELVCFDEELVYTRFFADFGPLNLAQTMRFVRDVDERLARRTGKDRGSSASATDECQTTVVVFSSDHPHKRANTMTLLALYLVISLGRTPAEAVAPFRSLEPPFGFRDAALGVCSFHLSLLDCAHAVHKAMTTELWRPEAFDAAEFERMARLENGDMTWIVPGKLLAFRGPQTQRERVTGRDHHHGDTEAMSTPEYAKALRALGITCVVRFNEPESYDRRAFQHAGLRHVELEYADGGVPTDAILLQFLRLCEREMAVGGAVAAHCTAGLGRTGTHVAAWLIRAFGLSAREAIAWCRICRPGSVVGPQQHFLVVKQREILSATVSATPESVSTRTKSMRRPMGAVGSEAPAPGDGRRDLRLKAAATLAGSSKAVRHRQERKCAPQPPTPTWSTRLPRVTRR